MSRYDIRVDDVVIPSLPISQARGYSWNRLYSVVFFLINLPHIGPLPQWLIEGLRI